MKEGACALRPPNARTFYPEQLLGGPGSAWGWAGAYLGGAGGSPRTPHARRSSHPTEASSQALLAFVNDTHISLVSRTPSADALSVRN